MIISFDERKKARRKRKPEQQQETQLDQIQAQQYQIQMQLATLEIFARLISDDLYTLLFLNADKIKAMGLDIDLSKRPPVIPESWKNEAIRNEQQ